MLGVGQSAKLNLTSPNYYDLLLKLDYLKNGSAGITMQTIHELVSEKETIVIKEKNENLVFYGALFLVTLVIILYILNFSKRKKTREELLEKFWKQKQSRAE
jgi:hypothetical protein